jgi:mannosyltransferase
VRTTALAVVGLTTFLFVRLFPDVTDKPLHEDEAVAGLISARPLGDMLHTVVLDRGGAPLHFLLAHVALALDTTADALRWLSLVFALATIPLCFDLGRRLAGTAAGLTAAALAATSQFLAIYGTFGRMYSLFAFSSVLAVDLFVRALDRPTRRTAFVAAFAALLPLAVHPFGAFLFAAEVAVATWLWRGRNVRAAVPTIAATLCALPLLLVNLRLGERYAGEDLAAGYDAREAGLRALGGAAGGSGVVLAVFVALAVAGAFVLARRRHPFAWLALLTLAAPPAALAAAGAINVVSDRVGPRHLVFMLPLWIGLVAAGVVQIRGMLRPVAIVVLVVVAFFAPTAIHDPRTVAQERPVEAPAAELRAEISPGDVLYPYSPVFLAALPAAAEARGFPREPVALARIADRTRNVPAVFISVATRDSWLILERHGPFLDGRDVLKAVVNALEETRPATAYSRQLRGAACAALDSRC